MIICFKVPPDFGVIVAGVVAGAVVVGFTAGVVVVAGAVVVGVVAGAAHAAKMAVNNSATITQAQISFFTLFPPLYIFLTCGRVDYQAYILFQTPSPINCLISSFMEHNQFSEGLLWPFPAAATQYWCPAALP